MSLSQCPLKVGPIPHTLRLYPGQVVTCTLGGVWITSDTLAGQGVAGDVVLRCGQAFVVRQVADYVVSGLRRYGMASLLESRPSPTSNHRQEIACY